MKKNNQQFRIESVEADRIEIQRILRAAMPAELIELLLRIASSEADDLPIIA